MTTAHELSRADAAHRLGLSSEAVDARIRNGQLPAFRRGRRVFLRTEDVERLLLPVRVMASGRCSTEADGVSEGGTHGRNVPNPRQETK